MWKRFKDGFFSVVDVEFLGFLVGLHIFALPIGVAMLVAWLAGWLQ